MSVIVVVSDGKRCVMASDSQATSNGGKAYLKGGKVIRRGALLLACDGSMALHDILRSVGTMVEGGAPLADWARSYLVPLIARAVRERGIARRVNEVEEWPGQVLVARAGEWVLIDAHGGVIEMDRAWHAIGSGGVEARGALMADIGRAPENWDMAAAAAERAVQVACALDDGCGGAYHCEFTEPAADA